MKYLKYLVWTLVTIGLSVLTGIYMTQFAVANPANIRLVRQSGEVYSTTTAIAYLAPGGGAAGQATSSLLFSSSDLFEKSLGVLVAASTTGEVLNWTIDTSPNGIDFFPYRYATSTTATNSGFARSFYATSTAQYSWQVPTNPATSSISVLLPDVPSNFLRINYSIEGGNAAVWSVVQGRRQVQ